MPEDLKMAILNLNNTLKVNIDTVIFRPIIFYFTLLTIKHRLQINGNVWVSCTAQAESEAAQNITMNFDGHIGFPNYYFPYENQPGFQTPFVAVQLSNLPSKNKKFKYKN